MAWRRRNVEPYEFSELATFNGERARGIVHTPEWEARMADAQERFNAQWLAKAESEGWTVVVAVPQPPTNDWPIFSVEGQSSYSSERLKRDAPHAEGGRTPGLAWIREEIKPKEKGYKSGEFWPPALFLDPQDTAQVVGALLDENKRYRAALWNAIRGLARPEDAE